MTDCAICSAPIPPGGPPSRLYCGRECRLAAKAAAARGVRPAVVRTPPARAQAAPVDDPRVGAGLPRCWTCGRPRYPVFEVNRFYCSIACAGD